MTIPSATTNIYISPDLEPCRFLTNPFPDTCDKTY